PLKVHGGAGEPRALRIAAGHVGGSDDPQQAVAVHDKSSTGRSVGYQSRHLEGRLLWANDRDLSERPGDLGDSAEAALFLRDGPQLLDGDKASEAALPVRSSASGRFP